MYNIHVAELLFVSVLVRGRRGHCITQSVRGTTLLYAACYTIGVAFFCLVRQTNLADEAPHLINYPSIVGLIFRVSDMYNSNNTYSRPR